MFIRFDMIHERDRQTDGQTDTDIYRAYVYASRGKNLQCVAQLGNPPWNCLYVM